MATAVFFHAHPDDEAIATGGTMAAMAAQGHRVVLVTATDGSLGEVPDGLLADGESLAERRAVELERAGAALGVHRQELLGYRDSGMAGEVSNDDPACFWQADIDEAAARLAAVLVQEHADVLTIYDERGGYGHPDHVQVHRVGVRAAEVAGTPRVFMATQDRGHLQDLARRAQELGLQLAEADPTRLATMGVEPERISVAVDVRAFLDAKRAAMQAHASQIADTSFFLALPDEVFPLVWGTECYVRLGGAPTASRAGTLVDDG